MEDYKEIAALGTSADTQMIIRRIFKDINIKWREGGSLVKK